MKVRTAEAEKFAYIGALMDIKRAHAKISRDCKRLLRTMNQGFIQIENQQIFIAMLLAGIGSRAGVSLNIVDNSSVIYHLEPYLALVREAVNILKLKSDKYNRLPDRQSP